MTSDYPLFFKEDDGPTAAHLDWFAADPWLDSYRAYSRCYNLIAHGLRNGVDNTPENLTRAALFNAYHAVEVGLKRLLVEIPANHESAVRKAIADSSSVVTEKWLPSPVARTSDVPSRYFSHNISDLLGSVTSLLDIIGLEEPALLRLGIEEFARLAGAAHGRSAGGTVFRYPVGIGGSILSEVSPKVISTDFLLDALDNLLAELDAVTAAAQHATTE